MTEEKPKSFNPPEPTMATEWKQGRAAVAKRRGSADPQPTAMPTAAEIDAGAGDDSMRPEIEIKLRLTPECVRRLKRTPILRSLANGRGRTHRLESRYFDTPQFDLRSAGMTLRVRHIGRRRIQTIKLPLADGSGLQRLREIECAIRGDLPDLTAIDDNAVRGRLRDLNLADRLEPMFATKIKRTIWPVRFGDGEIEAALDLGEIEAGEGRAAVAELELELRSGAPHRLFELALSLQQAMPVAWEYETKSARGFRLAADEPLMPERSQPCAIDPDMSARLAFTTIAQSCLRQIRANEGCARLGRDTEGLHQFRVGVRRLRALVAAYRKEIAADVGTFLAGGLDWLQAQCGAARDWDVFIAESLQRLSARLPGDPAVAAMLHAAGVLREESYVALRATLEDARYTELLLRLGLALSDGSWAAVPEGGVTVLEQPIADFAKRTLNRRYRKLRSIGGKRADLPEHELHRLRIAGKKLRYIAEFFRGIFPKKSTAKFIRALEDVQDQLGSLNDALVSRQLLLSLEGRIENASDIAAARHASGLILGWQAARVDRDLVDFQTTWRKLRGRRPFWK
jgi:inorganic triphosphatase YgiF